MASGTIMQPGGGAESNSNYIKFPDGTLIVFMRETFTTTINTAAGGGYVSGNKSLPNYPVAFVSTPARTFGVDAPNYGSVVVLQDAYGGTAASATNPGSAVLYRPYANNNSTAYVVSVIAIGRWK